MVLWLRIFNVLIRLFYMLCDLNSSLDGWDRTFLDLSSKMAEPFCFAWHLVCFRLSAPLDPEKFENCSTRTKEVALRILVGCGAVLGGFLTYAMPLPMVCGVVVLGLGSKALRAVGFSLQKEGYTHVRGAFVEKSLNPQDLKVKVMSWNICGVGGGMSLDHGGVIHWRSRLDAIVEKIKGEGPDVLILQEIYDTALAEALIDKLQGDFAHFFTHLGPSVWGSVGGCMVISKCAAHSFSYTSFTNNEWTLNRGFALLELKASPEEKLPCLRVIGTHFIHGDQPEDDKAREGQVAQIVDRLKEQKLSLPTILAGDLNIERDGKMGAFLSSYLHHSYLGAAPTCTNRMTAQWDCKARGVWGETIDYISLFKSCLPDGSSSIAIDEGVRLEESHLVEAFDESYNTKTALSDHHGLVVRMKLPPQNKTCCD